MSFLLLSEPAGAEVSDSHTWPEWQPKTPKIPKPQTAPNIFLFLPTGMMNLSDLAKEWFIQFSIWQP